MKTTESSTPIFTNTGIDDKHDYARLLAFLRHAAANGKPPADVLKEVVQVSAVLRSWTFCLQKERVEVFAADGKQARALMTYRCEYYIMGRKAFMRYFTENNTPYHFMWHGVSPINTTSSYGHHRIPFTTAGEWAFSEKEKAYVRLNSTVSTTDAPEETEDMSFDKNLFAALNPNVVLVGVKIDSGSYRYKSLLAQGVKVGDSVLVDMNNRLMLLGVSEIMPSNKMAPNIDYKWVIAVIDSSLYEYAIEAERRFNEEVVELERAAKRDTIQKQLEMRVGQEGMERLRMLVNGTTAPLIHANIDGTETVVPNPE